MSNLKFACRYLDGLSVSSKPDAVGCAENLSIRLSNADTSVAATKGEFALASTDMGHEGGMDADGARTMPRASTLPTAACTSPQ